MSLVPALPGSQGLRVQTLLEQAEFWAVQNDLVRARNLFLDAISLDDGLKSRWEYACFLHQISENSEAIEQLTRLWNEAKRRGQIEWVIAACESLAVIHRDRGQSAIARSYQQQAIATRVRSELAMGSDGFSVREFLALANEAVSCGDLAIAERFAACAQVGLDEPDSQMEAGDVWGTRGAVLLLKQELTAAWRCFLRAYCFHCRSGDDEGRVADLLNLASVSRVEGGWELARRLLVKASRMARRLNHPRLLARAERFLDEAERILAVARRVPEWN